MSLQTWATISVGYVEMELLGHRVHPFTFSMASTKSSSKNLAPVSMAASSHVTLLSLQDESGANRGL